LRTEIIRGLIALRKAGVFQCIWIDADQIRVRGSTLGPPYRLMWSTAQSLIEARRSSLQDSKK
jgi:hypothetical protein